MALVWGSKRKRKTGWTKVLVAGSYGIVPEPGTVTVPAFLAAFASDAVVSFFPAARASSAKNAVYRHASSADVRLLASPGAGVSTIVSPVALATMSRHFTSAGSS